VNKKNLYMAATIICGLLSVAFTFKMKQVVWLWHNNDLAGIILGFLALVFGLQWLKYQKQTTGKKN